VTSHSDVFRTDFPILETRPSNARYKLCICTSIQMLYVIHNCKRQVSECIYHSFQIKDHILFKVFNYLELPEVLFHKEL